MKFSLPLFDSDSPELNLAWRIAVGDLIGNIRLYQSGLLPQPVPCLCAGLDYSTPWTRDTAINTCFATAWLCPEVAKNSLLSLCVLRDGVPVVSGFGHDWDAAIWILGAYQYWQVTKDEDFLPLFREVSSNTLRLYENTAYDTALGLFRGPAVYGDGVAAYPDKFLTGTSCIIGCRQPMYALSTNAMFCMAYRAAGKLCRNNDYLQKATALKNAVQRHFWRADEGRYDYLAYECDAQEGLGVAFVLLSGIADGNAGEVLRNVKLTPNGIACVYPSFERYIRAGGLGRHSGTVWGFIQGFYGMALHRYGKTAEFDENLRQMASKACRDGQFSEIWHGDTGEIYGGLQEDAPDGRIRMWRSMRRQSWTASAFLALMVHGVFGCQWENGKMTAAPRLPEGVHRARIEGLGDDGQVLSVTSGE